MKKVAFTSKPTPSVNTADADFWVRNRHKSGEPTKRLTLDVPISLHRRIKSQCALQSVRMADVIRDLLEQRFAEEYSTGGGGQSAPN